MAAPDDRRQESRVRWSRTARGWEARADALRRATMPVSAWLVEALRPQPGDTVLELAAGPGDTGFLAAELIQPGGTLICSDFVPEMVSAAQRRAEALGIANARFRQIDAETAIDLDAASLDGVLCRWGYMLLAEPGTALQETRRVLKPGARVALAAWTGPDDNLWSALPMRELTRRGLVEPADPDAPGQFAWGREGVIAEHLEAAGFVDYEVGIVDFTFDYPSVQDWWDTQRELSTRVQDVTAALDPASAEDVLAALRSAVEPFSHPDGSLEIPARTWVAAATA
jgi:SAM-dependent methyltransferase